MNDSLDTLILRKAQEAEDAVLSSLRAELQDIGKVQIDLLRQVFNEGRKDRADLETKLQSRDVAVQSFFKEVSGALNSLRTDLAQHEARLLEQVQSRTKALHGLQESTAAEQRKALEAIFHQAKEARSILAGLPAVLAAQEQTLVRKQDSLRNEVGGLQEGIPKHFFGRDELRELLERKAVEQRSLLESSMLEMRKQIRIAQVLGGLAVVGVLATLIGFLL